MITVWTERLFYAKQYQPKKNEWQQRQSIKSQCIVQLAKRKKEKYKRQQMKESHKEVIMEEDWDATVS